MLEKIGLPAKPSMRGANWVIDASHCQGCSSQFTFFNRKHHCRRCGGIFCNSCTQQRMVLRGQGDSPVRICDPCKKLEEAARFEQRYGHKNRVAKGGSKQIPKTDDELVGEILGSDRKHSTPSRKESHVLSDSQGTGSSDSHASSSVAVSRNSGGEGDWSNSAEGRNDADIEIECSSSPEDLRQQAMVEKRRYRILKAEGKAEEALKAFKHGKELERQAGALEISIRRTRRMAEKVSSISSRVSTDRMDDVETLSSEKNPRNKEVKDDLFSELRQLGWSDTELHDADKKPVKISLEGELSNLLGETIQKSEIGRKKGGIDKTQVVAHKRRALLLKREGNLAEAKEELKKAKILEKQLEEQEFLGEASDSEDELYALIQNMGSDNKDDLMLENGVDDGANFEHLLGATTTTDDIPIDENLEVTDYDMNDPELGAALKSFGWTEEDEDHEENHTAESVHSSHGALLQAKILDLKKEALKKARVLEQDLGNNQINAPKSKMVIQKELLALKKKALTLRREGRLEDADDELKKGRVLEQQLEELEKKSAATIYVPKPTQNIDTISFDLEVDAAETNVTEEDMHDPTMLSALKKMGWNESLPFAMQNKAEIQRELLAIKRKALSLRRQGKTEEAEEELERAKELEKRLSDMESQSSSVPSEIQISTNKEEILTHKRNALTLKREGKLMEAKEELRKAKLLEKNVDEEEGEESSVRRDDDKPALPFAEEEYGKTDLQKPISSRGRFKLQQESLAHKRNSLKLRREGKMEEAEAEFEKAKKIEDQLEEAGSESVIGTDEDFLDPQLMSALKSIGWGEKDVMVDKSSEKSQSQSLVMEEQIKAAKLRALNLKRAGKQEEALQALRSAKKLEKKLDSSLASQKLS